MLLQIKDKKHIEWNFCSYTWAMPQGWDLGAGGGAVQGVHSFEYGHVEYQIDRDDG